MFEQTAPPTGRERRLNGDGDRLGLLLVGHGTRDPRGAAEFLETAQLMSKALRRVAIGPCFLELARPTIAQAVQRLVARGVRRLVVSPLLLFSAGHLQRDIPDAVAAASTQYPCLEIQRAAHLGCREPILELSSQRFREAVERSDGSCPPNACAPQDTALLIVGRGSYDNSAAAEMRQFVELRRRRTPVGHAAACFLAMAQPSLERALSQIGDLRFRRIVVQPHLLFYGELLADLRRQVVRHAARWPGQQWIVAEHLGATGLLAQAVIEAAGDLLVGSPSRSCLEGQFSL